MALRYFGCNTNPRVHKQEDYRDGHATKKIQLASRALSLTKRILKIKMEHFEGRKKKKKKLGKKKY